MWKNQQRTLSPDNNQLIQSLVITSDPQYPWTDCTDCKRQDGGICTSCLNRFGCKSGVPPCSDPNCLESDGTKKNRSTNLIKEQYDNINSYTDKVTNAAVIINGDMTAYGHAWQWSEIQRLLRMLKRRYYYGLGNHDIENNKNDCSLDGCFRNSMRYFIKHVEDNKIPSSDRDYILSSATGGGRHTGSFAYVVNFGTICSIQLNYYPTMVTESSVSLSDNYTIRPNIDWLKNKLAMAKSMGQIILVHVHQVDKLTGEYINLFKTYGVAAIFGGHYHQEAGYKGSTNGIPTFLSGSASQKTYLILEQFSDRLDIYTVKCNDWQNNKSKALTISINQPIFSGVYQIITALNNSSVIDRSPTKCNPVGDCNVHLWPNNNTANQKWRFEFDSSKQAYRIYNQQISGYVLAWNTENRDVFVTKFIQSYDEHYWILEPSSNGYIFKNKKNSSLVLDVANAQTKDGTNIGVHEKHSPSSPYIKAQEFKLRKL
ncbi:metallophosphoesterase [Bacillus thuringiensis]|uniref:metallophosphoesterase n=1 Tax=Bacillus thuringiensis TaxID=1428 RepID=UPI003CEEBA8B